MITVYLPDGKTFIDECETDEIVEVAYKFGDQYGDAVRKLAYEAYESDKYAEKRVEAELDVYEDALSKVETAICNVIFDVRKLQDKISKCESITAFELSAFLDTVENLNDYT